MAAHGAGLTLAPAAASAEDIRAALQWLLAEPGFRAAACRLGAAVAAEAASPAAVEELEALAAARAVPAA